MSNYVQSTNFATKDNLSSGDPLKIVKGTEINTEFANIAIAVATKADLASPTFTGTPALPTGTTGVTQSAGNSTTAIATTAFVQAAITLGVQSLHPVGSIYTAVVSTNPATLLGFGTWTSFGAGRVLVGVDASDPDFDTVEETGGAKTHSHTTNTVSDHTHTVPRDGWGTGEGPPSPSTGLTSGRLVVGSGSSENVETLESLRAAGGNNTTGSGGSHSHTVSTSSNVQPYITVYMWKRTA